MYVKLGNDLLWRLHFGVAPVQYRYTSRTPQASVLQWTCQAVDNQKAWREPLWLNRASVKTECIVEHETCCFVSAICGWFVSGI